MCSGMIKGEIMKNNTFLCYRGAMRQFLLKWFVIDVITAVPKFEKM